MLKRFLALLLLLTLLPIVSIAETEDPSKLPEFTFHDQYGREWTLADFEGKVVFLNFWTTWCPWCIREMPDIEALFHELGENEGDVLILGIDTPETVDTADEAGIAAFLAENGFTYPTLMDPEDQLGTYLGIQVFPTTFIIKPDGTILGSVLGAVDIETMREVIEQGRTEE
ncbi:MAG: TlpA family protein disulfide reductase [Clostridia bacterium]|nr:TlpA family protein disulfide reductase [Clostridia bacterium]